MLGFRLGQVCAWIQAGSCHIQVWSGLGLVWLGSGRVRVWMASNLFGTGWVCVWLGSGEVGLNGVGSCKVRVRVGVRLVPVSLSHVGSGQVVLGHML